MTNTQIIVTLGVTVLLGVVAGWIVIEIITQAIAISIGAVGWMG